MDLPVWQTVAVWQTCLKTLLFAIPFSNCSVTEITFNTVNEFTPTLTSPHGNICMSLMFGATHACYYANHNCSVLFLPDLSVGNRGMGITWLLLFNPSLKIRINPLRPITIGAHVRLSTAGPFRPALLTD